ncbi:capsule assembly Wzi family protein [Daejeonella sp.]|uniref:capsule assembly Wzi family protein n=1 Tax=Daejeonella sp. TaxID=2805397 RepID=UPI002B6B8E01|nr:capsule assembly Wzi family protein [Daejeonella sp.]HQT24941.1 capsule assembly Wzi family protein [Daejeonella sp.]
MIRKKVLLVILTQLLVISGISIAQTLPVGMPVLEDSYRREQLLGSKDSLISFTIRPLFAGNLLESGIDTLSAEDRLFKFNRSLKLPGNKAYLQLLPISLQHQYNSILPYDWNDGTMIPAKGNQTSISFGASFKYGPLSIQLKPEYVYAENAEFEGFPSEQYDVVWAKYYNNYFNVSDITERYGEDPYSKLFWGQSSVRLTFDPISIGISNENLWWGPGRRSSLLMSNNAAGFKHITINTSRPVQTPIGSFEAQLIAGRLENSGILPPQENRVYEGKSLYVPKRDDWRFLSGFVLTYSPKGVPGLFIGASQVSQMYKQDAGKRPSDFLPLLLPFESKDAASIRDRYSSLFFRWVLREANAEIYGEYGHQGKHSITAFLREPDRSAAYLLGLRKILPLNKHRGEYFQFSLEFTELQQTSVPEKGGWYTSSAVRQGYTHMGQVLGAGIGPGSNLQSLDISWFKGLKRIGLKFERYLHNNDFYYQMYIDPPDFRKHYVDMSAALSADWDYKNLVFSAKGAMIRSLNYQYVLYNRPPDYFVTGWDRLNYQVRLGVTYRF